MRLSSSWKKVGRVLVRSASLPLVVNQNGLSRPEQTSDILHRADLIVAVTDLDFASCSESHEVGDPVASEHGGWNRFYHIRCGCQPRTCLVQLLSERFN
jgi:hypothetical protein